MQTPSRSSPFDHFVRPLALSILAGAFVSAGHAQITSYGCGVNPSGSLTVVSGSPYLNQSFAVGIDNPLGTQACPTFTALFIDNAPDPAYPCGTILPGWGMSGPGANGELLINPLDGGIVVSGGTWGCSSGPATVAIPVPAAVGLVGKTIYLQGLMYDPVSPTSLALTEALEVVIGPSTPVAFGTSLRRSIDPANEIEVFQIAADAGDQLVIPYLRTTGSGFSLDFELHDWAGNSLAVSRSTSARFEPPPIPATGDYLLAVRTRTGVRGSYHATIERTRVPGHVVRSVAFGESVSSSISPSWTEIDVYDFPGRTGDVLEIPFTRTTGSGFTLQLELYDASGTRLDTVSASAGVFRPVPLPADGTYYLWVSNPSRNTTGSYHFTLQRMVDPGNRTAIAFGDDVRSSISPTWTEIDVYEFPARTGDHLFVPFTRTTGSGFTLRLQLVDAAGNVLDAISSSTAVFQPVAIPADGTYFLWVRNPSRNTTGSYHLTLQRREAPAINEVLQLPQSTIRRSITPAWTQVDVYRVSGIANLYLKAPFTRVTGSGFALELRLYDAAGSLVHTASGTSGRLCTVLPSTGDYFLWVRNPGMNVTGTYDFSVMLDIHGC